VDLSSREETEVFIAQLLSQNEILKKQLSEDSQNFEAPRNVSLKRSGSLPQSSLSPGEMRSFEVQINEVKNSLVRAEKEHQESVARMNRQMKEKEEQVKKKAEEIKGLRNVFSLLELKILEFVNLKSGKDRMQAKQISSAWKKNEH
jgi:hypothetical protein